MFFLFLRNDQIYMNLTDGLTEAAVKDKIYFINLQLKYHTDAWLLDKCYLKLFRV